MTKDSVFVNCWKCEKKFDITCAERCYEHLNYYTFPPDIQERKPAKWTTKCPHCGACICHKFYKMKPICENLADNPRIKESEISSVMPSVHKKYCEATSIE